MPNDESAIFDLRSALHRNKRESDENIKRVLIGLFVDTEIRPIKSSVICSIPQYLTRFSQNGGKYKPSKMYSNVERN